MHTLSGKVIEAHGAPAVHYPSGHVVVQGITVPTRHTIYVRDADGGHQPEPLVVSIHASEIRFF